VIKSPTGSLPRLKSLTIVILLTVIALFAYSNTFDAPFVFDDRHNILENPYIRMTDFSSEGLTKIFKSPSSSRPLANFSFAVNFLFHQYDVSGYHVVNLIIHIINALLIWLITRQTLRLCHSEDPIVPFFAAVLWLVNPLHTQSVTYIVQRMNAMATLFYLLSLSCYIQARVSSAAGPGGIKPRLLYMTCLSAAVLGLASKEIVTILPVMLLLYEWFFFRNLDQTWPKKQLPWMSLAIVSIFALAVLYTDGAPLEKIRHMYAKQTFSMDQRLLTETGVIIYYISLIFFPHPSRLTIDYDFPVSSAPTEPLSTALAITAIIMLIIGAGYAAGKHRLISFAILWFLISLVIESSFLGLYLIFDHRTYLPSIFPVIGLVWLLFTHIRPKALIVIMLCLIIGVNVIWTSRRNNVRSDAILLWQDAADKVPGKARPYNDLGFSLLQEGKTEQAIVSLSRGLLLDPYNQDIHNTIAIAYHLTGDSARALRHCRTAIEINPDNIEARNTMGFILREQGKPEQAETNFRQVLAKAPDNFEAVMNMAFIKQQQGDMQTALPWFQKAVELNPVSGKALYYFGAALAICDRPDDAIVVLNTALQTDTYDKRAHCVLAGLMLNRDEANAAIAHYEHAFDLNVDCPGAGINLARMLFEKGETRKAISRLNDAVRRSPDNAALIWQAVMMMTETGHFKEAAGHLESMILRHPANPKLLYNLACLYARQKDTDRALAALKKAVDGGYDNWSRLQTDKDLENIRGTTYYQNLSRKNNSTGP